MSSQDRREFLETMAAGSLGLGARLHGVGEQSRARRHSPQARADERPNIVVIMADDMEFSDVSCYGGEIDTSNVDRLADDGLRFSQFYNTARCPTRASTLTGLYPHQASMGFMMSEGDDLGLPGYRAHLNDDCVTIAEVLGQEGYNTVMSGKWHVGEGTPILASEPGIRPFQRHYPGGV